jgi:hypothetical protein
MVTSSQIFSQSGCPADRIFTFAALVLHGAPENKPRDFIELHSSVQSIRSVQLDRPGLIFDALANIRRHSGYGL